VSRGYFDFLKNQPAYTQAEKDWYVELQQSTYVWYDAIIDPPEGFDMAAETRRYLRELRKTVKNTLDKHFVYFLASRLRVRFCIAKPPRYQFIGGKLEFHIEVGRARKRRKCTVSILNDDGTKRIRPKVDITDRYLTIHHDTGGKLSMSIHEVLERCDDAIGISSEIQYVGYTDNPEERPLNREHRGFGDMLHWTANTGEDYDYFIYYNLFKVTSIALDQDSPLNFMVANSMSDEVPVGEEGRILEKVLIKYFSPKPQELNKQRESAELNNQLVSTTANLRINSITFDIEMRQPCELFRFYSRAVAPADRHHFTCQIGSSGAEIVPPKRLFDTRLLQGTKPA
jgi:hypothetical protein